MATSSTAKKAASSAEKDKTPTGATQEQGADQATTQGGGTGDPGTTDPQGPDAPSAAVTNESATPGSGDAQPAGTEDQPQTGRTEDSGPQTGRAAPPESSYRYPSTIVEDPEGNPLAPPSDTPRQTQPEQGHNLSSTDHVYAQTGGRTVAGEDFKRFVDDDGHAIEASALFDDSDQSKTFVTAKQRVYEEFYYPNTTEVCRRQVFAAGKRVPRAQAEQIKAAIKAAPTPAVEQD